MNFFFKDTIHSEKCKINDCIDTKIKALGHSGKNM